MTATSAAPAPDVPVVEPHVPLAGQVLSTHRTSAGTNRYVRCSCGGFVLLAVDRHGAQRQLAHAAGPVR